MLCLFSFGVVLLLWDICAKSVKGGPNLEERVAPSERRRDPTHTFAQKNVWCDALSRCAKRPLGKEEAVKWGFSMYGQLDSQSHALCLSFSRSVFKLRLKLQTHPHTFKHICYVWAEKINGKRLRPSFALPSTNNMFPTRADDGCSSLNVWFHNMLQIWAAFEWMDLYVRSNRWNKKKCAQCDPCY